MLPPAEEPAGGGRLETRSASIQAKRGGAVAAALSLGGNVGDVAAAFAAALAALAADPACTLTACSSVYRTPPWGRTDQPDFLNMAVLLSTALSPRELLDLCLAIERRLGRERREMWGPRTLDIDVLTYDEVTLDEPSLVLPHPRIAERAFVLVPLAEIAPGLRIGGATIAELLARIDARGIEIDAAATERTRLIG
jgi:2-amino-4-hydroxy-6-hydroxymethyldihydropteridine diphosphokinase